MAINHRELSLVIQEANTLSTKATLSRHEERRLTFLMSAASAIKAGASLADLEIDQHNEISRENGLPVIRTAQDGLTIEQRDTAKFWKHGVEQRDVEGNQGGKGMLSHIGTYTGLGSFVPTEFFGNVVAALKAHDPLFDEDFCSVLNASNGRIQQIPTMGDIENVASIVGEAGSQTETDISSIGSVTLPVFAYKSPRYYMSNEAFQDLSEVVDAVKLFTNFASSRLRRGIGSDLVNGFGNGVMPLGLLASLEQLGSTVTPPVIAAGDASMTGNGNPGDYPANGGTTIGLADLTNLYFSVDSAYRASDKCFWLMSDAVLNFIDSLITSQGVPAHIVKWDEGVPKILGKEVKISPSMPALPQLTSPAWPVATIVFGDFSYWFTKIVTGVSENGTPLGYVQTYTEADGLIENGMVGFRAFLRAGGVLAFTDRNSPAPLNLLLSAARN